MCGLVKKNTSDEMRLERQKSGRPHQTPENRRMALLRSLAKNPEELAKHGYKVVHGFAFIRLDGAIIKNLD